MPRITISIPNDLQLRLADPGVRKSINVSRTCQDALRREVNRLLDLPLDLTRMQSVIQRLRKQRSEVQARWFEAGAAEAREWVEHEAGYSRLQELGRLSLEARLAALRSSPPEPLARARALHREARDFDEGAHAQGWAVALGLLWDALESKV